MSAAITSAELAEWKRLDAEDLIAAYRTAVPRLIAALEAAEVQVATLTRDLTTRSADLEEACRRLAGERP